MKWYDLYYGVLFEPAKTLSGFGPRQLPLGPGTAAFVLTAAVNMWVSLTSGTGGIFPMDILAGDPLLVLAGLPVALIFWGVTGALIALVIDLLGGRSDPAGVLAGTGLAVLPQMLSAPVILIGRWTGSGITAVLSLALSVWSVYILYVVLRQNMDLSRGKSLIALLSPLIAIFVVFSAAAVMMIVLMGTLLPGELPGPTAW